MSFFYKNFFRNFHISKTEDGTHTLEIRSVELEQIGEISCQAKNIVGLKRQLAQLNVKEVGEAPIFLQYLEDRLVTEKETLVMEAKLAQVRRKPTVTWLKNGQPFTGDEHFKISEEENGLKLKLVIISTEMEDKSRITIKAENAFGSAGN